MRTRGLLGLLLLVAATAGCATAGRPSTVPPTLRAVPPPAAQAAMNVTLSWQAAPRATSYEIEASVDAGATWTKLADVPATACAGPLCQHTLPAPAAGQVLYRYVSKNAVGRTVRYDAGSWSCETCTPPVSTEQLGIK